MASKKKKQVSEKQRELNRQYYNARRNYIRNIKSLEDRGYDVSALNIPDKPQKITEGSIRRIKDLNEKRYKKSTFQIIDNDTGEIKNISGSEARTIERRIAAQVGRSLDKFIDKHYNEDVYYNPATGETMLEAEAKKYTGNIPLVKTTFPEIERLSKMDLVPMKGDDSLYTYFRSIIRYYEDYTVYTGTKKTSKKQVRNARYNAMSIIDFLESKYAEDPKGTVKTLIKMKVTDGTLTNRLFLYADGGSDAFVVSFFNIFEAGVDLDSVSDMSDSTDTYNEED